MGLLDVVRAREIENVKQAIMEKYGFEPSSEYCRDLITFLEALEVFKEEVGDVKGS